MDGIKPLIDGIYNEIKARNYALNAESIPLTMEFYEYLADKYDLVPFAIPRLIKILVDSHMILSIAVVDADRRTRSRRSEGLVVADSSLIKSIIAVYEEELIRAYALEFGKKYTIDRIMQEFIPLLDKYNNTGVGKIANIVLNLRQCHIVISKNIAKYSEKWQSAQLAIELGKCEPLSYFINRTPRTEEGGNDSGLAEDVTRKKSGGLDEGADLKRHAKKNSIESTLAVYGIEFYTRVCFKDYQYSLILKLIEQGLIKKKDDLNTVKRLLQKERRNADQNIKINEYAAEINNLEKIINSKLKED